MSARPRIAVLVFPGSNDDRDAVSALEGLGAEVVAVWHAEPELPHGTAPENALEAYLDEARSILASADGQDDGAVPELGADFEHLRWFELPAACVA